MANLALTTARIELTEELTTVALNNDTVLRQVFQVNVSQAHLRDVSPLAAAVSNILADRAFLVTDNPAVEGDTFLSVAGEAQLTRVIQDTPVYPDQFLPFFVDAENLFSGVAENGDTLLIYSSDKWRGSNIFDNLQSSWDAVGYIAYEVLAVITPLGTALAYVYLTPTTLVAPPCPTNNLSWQLLRNNIVIAFGAAGRLHRFIPFTSIEQVFSSGEILQSDITTTQSYEAVSVMTLFHAAESSAHTVSEIVKVQMQDYAKLIASLYTRSPYHNESLESSVTTYL